MKRVLFAAVSLFLLMITLLPGLVLTANAGAPIGTAFIISDASEVEINPAIAYNSQRQEYLVVWYNDRSGNDDIRARRVSRNGTPIGGPFYIAATGGERRYPDVAYNSAADQYLVVWEFENSWGFDGIHGRRVSGTGQVLDANDIEIQSVVSIYTPVKPAVAYSSTSDRYLVVWQKETGGLLWDVHGQQIQGGGSLYQNDITIAYYTVSSTNPAVAAIPTTPSNYKFLVVWEANLTGQRDIYGHLVAEDGTPASSAMLVAGTGVDQSSPAVAGSEGGNRYLVTWRQSQGVVDIPIHGRSISYDGVFQDEFNLAAPAADSPAVAAGPASDFLIAWKDQPVFATNSDIYGQLWGNRVYLPAILLPLLLGG